MNLSCPYQNKIKETVEKSNSVQVVMCFTTWKKSQRADRFGRGSWQAPFLSTLSLMAVTSWAIKQRCIIYHHDRLLQLFLVCCQNVDKKERKKGNIQKPVSTSILTHFLDARQAAKCCHPVSSGLQTHVMIYLNMFSRVINHSFLPVCKNTMTKSFDDTHKRCDWLDSEEQTY